MSFFSQCQILELEEPCRKWNKSPKKLKDLHKTVQIVWKAWLKRKDPNTQIVIFIIVLFSFSLCKPAMKYSEMVKKVSTFCWLVKNLYVQFLNFYFRVHYGILFIGRILEFWCKWISHQVVPLTIEGSDEHKHSGTKESKTKFYNPHRNRNVFSVQGSISR